MKNNHQNHELQNEKQGVLRLAAHLVRYSFVYLYLLLGSN
jgi:hypothetical protein